MKKTMWRPQIAACQTCEQISFWEIQKERRTTLKLSERVHPYYFTLSCVRCILCVWAWAHHTSLTHTVHTMDTTWCHGGIRRTRHRYANVEHQPSELFTGHRFRFSFDFIACAVLYPIRPLNIYIFAQTPSFTIQYSALFISQCFVPTTSRKSRWRWEYVVKCVSLPHSHSPLTGGHLKSVRDKKKRICGFFFGLVWSALHKAHHSFRNSVRLPKKKRRMNYHVSLYLILFSNCTDQSPTEWILFNENQDSWLSDDDRLNANCVRNAIERNE